MKSKGDRHEKSRFMKQIYDCVGECHCQERMTNSIAVVENAYQNSADGKVKICLGFRKAVIEEAPISDDNGVG